MNPSSIGSSDARQREQQAIQLTAMKAATDERLKARKEAKTHLSLAVGKIQSIGMIPALTDVHKIGAAIEYIAKSLMVSADLDIKELEAQSVMLGQTLKAADSPIIPVQIGR